jgi:hypothetical protein
MALRRSQSSLRRVAPACAIEVGHAFTIRCAVINAKGAGLQIAGCAHHDRWASGLARERGERSHCERGERSHL